MKKKKVSQKVNYISTIDEINKGNLKPYYILIGDTNYLKNQIIEKIKLNLKISNIFILEGESNLRNLIDSIDSPSFFSSSKVIFIKNAQKIENFKWDYFKNIKNRVIIFDDRDGKIPLPQEEIEDKVKIVNDKNMNLEILKKWVEKKFKEKNKSISQSALYKLIFSCENDLDLLIGEIEKLSLIDKDIIDEEDIEKYVYQVDIPNIFDLINYFIKNKKRKFLENFSKIIERGENFEKLFYTILNHITSLIDVKISILEGVKDKDIIDALKINPYRYSLLKDEASEFNLNELKTILKSFEEIEKSIKLSKGFQKERMELTILKS
ncbi:MAG TPA: DNA polymerase III subunit delta [Caldisericia bacterium]|nr:DNA polymerase III subunit delta [Caldisericia bacterium]HOL83220.1 DNA polymerase III subunit delta [Caldisericia bacterium]